ncbi:MAG TPA: PP2C family protein-serine/threonine phosphatase [Mycobacteriales bacterium]|nr:PP2C family protein-serine/threonine phosphatase [Mycobacteriales bacterium]
MTDRRGQVIGALLAAGWLVGMTAGDIATRGPRVVLTVFFGVSPLLACAVLSPMATAAFAVVAVALAAGSGGWDHTWGLPQHYVRIANVTVVGAVAVVVSAVRVRRERQRARLVAIADAAQRAVLPRVPERTGPIRTATRYLSAAEDALVGGDFYDLYHSDRWIRLVIGDVRGKGLQGVEHAARVIRAFRQSAAASADLPAVAQEMNDYLIPFFSDEEFATALIVQVDDRNELTVVNCGHPPALLVGATDVRAAAAPANLPLGLGDGFASAQLRWSAGDRLLLYTDGLVEARDAGGRFLSVEALGEPLRRATVEESLDALLDLVRAHVPHGSLGDDLALMLLENVGGAVVAGAGRPGLTRRNPAA